MSDQVGIDERDKLLEKETTDGQKYERGHLHTLKGVAGSVTSVLVASTSITSVQLLERRIPDFELNTFRFALPLVICILWLVLNRDSPCMSRVDMVPTVKYSIAVFFGSTVYFLAVPLVPAAAASCLMCTTNIVGCFTLFYLFHNEKIRLTTVLSAVMCVTGLVMVLQPGFGDKISKFYTTESESLLNSELTVTNDNVTQVQNSSDELKLLNNVTMEKSAINLNETVLYEGHTRESFLSQFEDIIHPTSLLGQITGYSLVMVSGLGFSWSLLISKQNHSIQEHISKFFFWVCFVNCVISFALMLIFEIVVLPSNWFDVAMATIHCIAAATMWPLYLISSRYVSGPLFSLFFTMEIVVLLVVVLVLGS